MNGITLDDSAKKAIEQFRKNKNLMNELKVRLAVQRGGCSGFSYHLGFDQMKPTDMLLTNNEIEIIIDPIHFKYVEGIQIGHVIKEDDSFFTFDNPAATRTCGCGTSFNIDTNWQIDDKENCIKPLN
jgi:iron-sulfur cluster assembly protein